MSLGSISSFSLANRAGYSCYMRAAYCSCEEDGATSSERIVITERLGDHLNLGDSDTQSLKDAGVPSGAQVQLVIELVAAGSPMRIADEVYTYSDSSFRTASFKCSGTVFNPKLERIVRRPAPPPTAMTMTQAGTGPFANSYPSTPRMDCSGPVQEQCDEISEKEPLLRSDKQEQDGQNRGSHTSPAGWRRLLCCQSSE